MPFCLFEARVHALLWSSSAVKGITVGPHDLLVAASAVANDVAVATLNQKAFRRIPELTLAPVAQFTKSRRRLK
jgi:tRNA(fMet)-specific endonuclease VapC